MAVQEVLYKSNRRQDLPNQAGFIEQTVERSPAQNSRKNVAGRAYM